MQVFFRTGFLDSMAMLLVPTKDDMMPYPRVKGAHQLATMAMQPSFGR